MKQGRASSNTDYRKSEPVPHNVNVMAVGRLGNKIGTHSEENGETRNATGPLEQGRGFSAPKDDSISHHKSGSQGRY